MMMQNDNEILKEEREEMNYADPAPKFARLVNYVVDWVATGVIVNATKFGIAYITFGERYREHIYYKVIDMEHIDLEILKHSLYVTAAVTFLYYFIFEGITRGRTLGKILTDTVAITQDGTPFTFNHALIRTLCRFIPFEMFSAVFAYLPWHDSISKTAVVRKTW